MQTIEFIPDRLNAKAIVFHGLTTHEIFTAAGIGFMVGLFLGLLLVALIGWVIVPTCALIMPLLVVFCSGKGLTKLKRGKPENYIYRLFALRLQQWGLSQFIGLRRLSEDGLITVSQGWFLRRSQSVRYHWYGGDDEPISSCTKRS